MRRTSGLVPLLGLVVCLVAACSEPADEGFRTVSIEAPSSSIWDDGEKVELTVTAAEPTGAAGEGWVLVHASHGSVASGLPEATVKLTSGKAKVTYACEAAVDPFCRGVQRVRVTWMDTGDSFKLEVRSRSSSVDGGVN